jgi:hypothetical protein
MERTWRIEVLYASGDVAYFDALGCRAIVTMLSNSRRRRRNGS